jgi:hypothetical protein
MAAIDGHISVLRASEQKTNEQRLNMVENWGPGCTGVKNMREAQTIEG